MRVEDASCAPFVNVIGLSRVILFDGQVISQLRWWRFSLQSLCKVELVRRCNEHSRTARETAVPSVAEGQGTCAVHIRTG